MKRDTGFWLCTLLLILCPPLALVIFCMSLWEDYQYKKWKRARMAECAGQHTIIRDPYWDIYPDLRKNEYYCEHCSEPGTAEDVVYG